MTDSEFRFGFRIVGGCFETRRLVDAAAPLSAYAAPDPRCEPHKESYLSAFQFGESFRRHLEENQGSTAGFMGPCWSPWLWFDVDREDLETALRDARRLAAMLEERYKPGDDDLLVFFSGSKGFHVGLPTCLWSPAPGRDFHQTARRFAEYVADLADVTIDTGVYDRVRAFRAPNSRHSKTGLHKRWLSLDELNRSSLEAILHLVKKPAPFDLPKPTRHSDQAAADWQDAVEQATRESEARAARRVVGNGTPTLNRATLEFIREGAPVGDRHRRLYSAAANLREFDCPPTLAVALLEEPGLDSGLPPKEVRRQIECGLAAVGSAPTPRLASESPQDGLGDSAIENRPQAAASDSEGSVGHTCQQVTRATLPPLPEPYKPLLAGAVGSGTLDTPCRCGSTEYADVAITGGRTRRDCGRCGRFLGFGQWHKEGGPTS
jgi:hypothetical protein